MSNYSIGLSGLNAAQEALTVIGNNIANAATEGYHRQRVDLVAAYTSQVGSVMLGGGVNIKNVTRLVDNLLEQEILRQQSSLGHIAQEFSTLRTIENAFGELSTGGGLNAVIDDFFKVLADLEAHPGEIIYQNQALSAAEAMSSRFRTLAEFLTTLENQIKLEAENSIEQINVLINQIAELNSKIESAEISGGTANNLRDQRDQCITELAGLIGVQTQSREYGVVDVTAGGIMVVTGAYAIELEVGLNANQQLGIGPVGASSYNTDVQGGRLGGLLSLRNDLVSDIHTDLDTLVGAIIQQVNQYHVQGIGSAGSFTELTGWAMTSENLADFDPSVTDGKIYIRVTNTSTEEITRNEINIDASTDTLTSIATDITAITGLTASVVSSKLSIQADTNYKFDFLPGVLSEPTTSNLTPDVSISLSDMLTYLNTDDGESNELQTISSTGTGGTFNVAFGADNVDIGFDASASAIETALAGLSTIGAGNVSCTGGDLPGSPVVVEFKGTLAATDVADLVIDNTLLTGGTASVAEARQGHATSYTGAVNQIYTCRVVGTGEVGNDANLKIVVEIGTDVVKTLDVGTGYSPGDRLDIGNGLFISIGTGTLNDSEEFTIEALASSDTSGVLASAGMNTFFKGEDALGMTVCSDITATPGRIATARNAVTGDNTNASLLADLKDQTVSSLGNLTPGQFYRQLVIGVGQQVSLKQMRQENIEGITQNLNDQKSEISGVDINDEAIRLLVFEQMFQAMAKYMNTVQSTIVALMEMV